MATIVRKSVSIFRDMSDRFKTSRKAQWTTLLVVVVALGGWYGINRIQERQQAQQISVEQKARLVRSLFRFQFLDHSPNAVVLGIDTRTLPQDLRELFSDRLRAQLSADFPSRVFATSVILSDFYSAGYFEKVFGGDLSSLDEVDFFKSAGSLLLIRPNIQFHDSSTVSGMKSCDISLVCRSYSSSHNLPNQITVHGVGLGFTTENAMTKTVELLGERQKPELASLLKE